MKANVIPNYALYGEQSEQEIWGGIHIEDIADRSSERGWHIKPHRHGRLFQMLCLFDGKADVWADSSFHPVEGVAMVVLPRGVVHGFQFEPNSNGVVITLTEERMTQLELPENTAAFQTLQRQPEVVSYPATSPQTHTLRQVIDMIRDELRSHSLLAQGTLPSLCRLLLLNVARQYQYNRSLVAPLKPKLQLLNHFNELIESHFRDHWSMAQYANRLHVSTSTLNRACREHYQTSAKALLQNRLINEAKRRLLFTQLPIEQIAYSLGFNDPAYFARAFRKHQGVAPGQFRADNQAGEV